MPLYVADYLADTSHLRAAQSGAYLHLIMHYWRKGGLPDDDAQLAAIARMDMDEWQATRPVVQAFFQDGWRHKRIDAEIEHAAEVSSKRRTAANQRHSNSNAIAELKDTQSQSHTQEEEKKESKEVMRANARQPTRGTRLPIDWQPDAAAKAYALSLGVPLEVETEKFRDYWHARAGPGGVKVDWSATWRTWCRNSLKFNGNGSNAKAQSTNRFRDALDKLGDSIEADRRQGTGQNPLRLLSNR
jgi:uncharacterized protein YdaU (DUF1376 family)